MSGSCAPSESKDNENSDPGSNGSTIRNMQSTEGGIQVGPDCGKCQIEDQPSLGAGGRERCEHLGSPRANCSCDSGAFSKHPSINGTCSVASTRAEDCPGTGGSLVLRAADTEGMCSLVLCTGRSVGLHKFCVKHGHLGTGCFSVAGTHGRCIILIWLGGRLTAMLMSMLPCLPTRPWHGVHSSGTTRARFKLRGQRHTTRFLRQMYRGGSLDWVQLQRHGNLHEVLLEKESPAFSGMIWEGLADPADKIWASPKQCWCSLLMENKTGAGSTNLESWHLRHNPAPACDCWGLEKQIPPKSKSYKNYY